MAELIAAMAANTRTPLYEIKVTVGAADLDTELGALRVARNMLAATPGLCKTLAAAATTFRTYETIHRKKGTPEGDEKAENNRIMADQCETALAKARGQ